ncbi:MAG TPA: transglutaminase-like domain-containing protein [Vicinamibacteria bacterium]
MRRVSPAAARVGRAVALAAAVASLALALRGHDSLVLALALLALASLGLPVFEWSPPPRLARLLPRAFVLVLLAVALLGWLSRSLSLVPLPTALLLAGALPLLLPLAAAFALAPGDFPAGRTLVPSVLALLALAGLDPAPAGYGPSPLSFLPRDHNAFVLPYAFLALVVLVSLWSAELLEGGPRWRRRDVLAIALVLAAAAALAAAGIGGLPALQPHVERAVASAFDSGSTGLSGESTLGEFAELAVSRRVVLDLRASAPGVWRLPSEVFTRFDGRRWTNATPAPRTAAGRRGGRGELLRPGPPPAGPPPLLDGLGAWFALTDAGATGLVAVRVDQAEVGRWPLLLPRAVSAVTADAHALELDRQGLVRRPGGLPLTLYGALVAARPRTVAPPPVLDDADRVAALDLPSFLDPRVAALADRLSVAADDPRGRLEATVGHLQAGYRYTLAPGAFRSGDPLAEFLFETREGYCEYFASAAVVLLRRQGVPARFVKGLAVGPQNEVALGLHVVRESDAHAWIEAWIPGEGWVEEDPTPPGALEAARGRPGGLERLLQRTRAALSSAWNRLASRGPWAFAAWLARETASALTRAAREPRAWLALLLALAGPRAVRLWRSRRRVAFRRSDDGAPVPAELRARVRQAERRWAAAGRPRPAHRGLLEHAPEADRPLIEAYYQARFGHKAATRGSDLES